MLACPAAARLPTTVSARPITSSAPACAPSHAAAASTASRSLAAIAPAIAARASAGEANSTPGVCSTGSPASSYARGDAQDLLPHSGAAVGSDISQERAPGEQLEGRMEHERVRGVTPRDGDDSRGGGEELLVGERVEAAGRVRRAYVGGIDPEAVDGRGGGIAHGGDPKTST